MDPILGVRHAAIRRALPPGACDCHTHVFGPHARFPLDADRRYTPGEASVAALLALQAALGMDRVVIVQPSPYGTDNSCTLDAVRQLGGRRAPSPSSVRTCRKTRWPPCTGQGCGACG